MFDRETHLFGFNLGYVEKLTADLTDAQLVLQPAAGLNTPLWLLGHLATSADFGLKVLGRPGCAPAAWGQAFGPGSRPEDTVPNPPTKAELLDVLRRGHAALAEAARVATAEQLAAVNPLEFARAALPTVGLLVAHLLTTHEAVHLGQLSAWRRVAGLAAV